MIPCNLSALVQFIYYILSNLDKYNCLHTGRLWYIATAMQLAQYYVDMLKMIYDCEIGETGL